MNLLPTFPGLMPSRDRPLYDILDNPNAIPASSILPIAFLIIAPWTLFWVMFIRRTTIRPSRRETATILVLGDIGRSPRMMYHAASLAKHGWETWIVGYGDTTPIPALIDNPLIHLLHLAQPPKVVEKLPWIARAPIRIAYQIFSVIQLAVWMTPCNTELLLVQNPPAIPTLILAQLISTSAGSRLVIDWHNTGYSILGMRVGHRSPLTKIARWIESTFGESAAAHLFVTKALQDSLIRDFDLEGRKAVLYDRPPSHFRSTPTTIQHELFHRLLPSFSPQLPASLVSSQGDSTPFTEILTSGEATLKADRPAFVVSSTSWTADEDFSLLITALDAYQASIDSGTVLPKLLAIITGKGALRSKFEKTVAEREKGQWKDITVRCVFVSAEDYPILLGCADLGVSLHTSSSGKDLPMKVVDMFGSGVPVLAKKFECIGELVKDGKNGRVFDSGEEMGEQLIDTLSSFPKSEKLDTLRSFFDAQAQKGSGEEWSTWDENWDKVVYEGLLVRRFRREPAKRE